MEEFHLERYFARYEFSARYLLSSSDCESLVLSELVERASADLKKKWQQLSLGYTESQGLPLLRELIATDYEEIRSDQILVAAPEELIFIAMHALLSMEDEVIVVHPSYQSLSEVARSIGCKVKQWTMAYQGKCWQLDLDSLLDLISPATRMVVVNFPHNPTGFHPGQEWWQRLVHIARSHNLILFSDEMYRHLEPEPSSLLPAACDIYELGISLSGLSKAFSAPGLRIGWLVSRIPGFIQRCQVWRDYTTICNSAPSEVLACMILEQKDQIVSANKQLIRQNNILATNFFDTHSDLIAWIPPLAGPIAFPRWKGSLSLDNFCQRLVEDTGVMIVPASQFDMNQPHFRIGLGRKNFPEGIDKLQDYLKSIR